MNATTQAETESLRKARPLQRPPSSDSVGGKQGSSNWASRGSAAATLAVGQASKVDAALIGPSCFASRHSSGWDTKSFRAFKKTILSTGGNLQPILVRPAAPGGDIDFEVVCGHRRHRACLDLGLPVLVVVEEMDDREMGLRIVIEQYRRKDNSAYERGCQLKAVFDAGFFRSHRQMVKAAGLDHSEVSRLIKLAELPQAVVDAFRSHADLNVRWGAPLHAALEEDREGVLHRAASIKSAGGPSDKHHVFALLVGAPLEQEPGQPPLELEVKCGEDVMAIISVPPASQGEGITVRLARGAIDADQLKASLMNLLASSASCTMCTGAGLEASEEA